MIDWNNISEGDTIKVLVKIEDEEDVEEEYLADVKYKEDKKLIINYLVDTNMYYKDAPIFKFEEETNEVEYESISEHFTECLSEIGYTEIDENKWVKTEDVDSECSDSDIHDYSSEDNNSFIAPEDPSEWELPPDHEAIDNGWRQWTPKSEGERRYRDMVDRLDAMAKIHKDNLDFEKNV
jgi:hypothetical protein